MNNIFKFISLLLVGFLGLSILIPTKVASASELEPHYYSEECISNECESTDHLIIDQTGEDNSRAGGIAGWIIRKAAVLLIMDAIHTEHALTQWRRYDLSGFNAWNLEMSNGRYHCYNMCSQHEKSIPYDYGYKDKYNCRMGCIW